MTLFLSLPFPPLRCESRPFDIRTVGRLRQMRSTNRVSPSKAHLRLASLDLRHFIDIFLKGQPLHDYSVVWAFLFTVSVEQTLARGNLLRGELWLRHSGVLFTTDHWTSPPPSSFHGITPLPPENVKYKESINVVTILFGYGSQNRYFFNEVIGWVGGGRFQRKPDKKKVSCRVWIRLE